MKTISLSGDWELTQAGTDLSCPVTIPGDNCRTLLEAGIIPDPYYRGNEEKVQWIWEEEWIIQRHFTLDREILDKKAVFFCDGVDTRAEIYINDRRVGSTDNLFRGYRFQVKEFLVKGRNTIAFRFFPPGQGAAREVQNLPYALPYIPVNKVPHMNAIRSMQCKTGWNWGICLPVCGLYGRIVLKGVSRGFIESATTSQIHGEKFCRVSVASEIFCVEKVDVSFEDFTWMSQVLHGLGIYRAVGHWRSLAPYCMGTFFWQ
jgi:beta-mannosidase